jgi:hypothetical protein
MEMTIYNPQKGRLESMNVTVNKATTTWFDDCLASDDIYMITDTDNGLLIRENNYSYPVLLYLKFHRNYTMQIQATMRSRTSTKDFFRALR